MHAHPSRRIALLVLLGGAPEVLAESPRQGGVPAMSATGECPSSRRVTAKPQELARRVEAAKSTREVRELLQSVGMGVALACGQGEAVASARLAVSRARLLSAEVEDFVLLAEGTVCGEEKLLDGVVLHPTGAADSFCVVPMPFLPGLVEPGHSSTGVIVENLTDPVRQVLRVVTVRRAVHEWAYWEGEAGALRSIFSVTWGFFGGDDRREMTAKVSTVGSGFPRELEVRESIRESARFAKSSRGGRAYEPGSRTKERTYRLCYRREAPEDPRAYAPCPTP
ncbi:hypothetical protein LZ198_28090 [Myxococcus sp. K15C18031901]|uniref:hypothetical protein n=1 Tax=Myxococcus dinghuensis TaxID=2906761 RepID=UPI0020A7BB6A|nr:hypothetical protein [Myxococcus dinghuensis]MCP3102743.1 hypothetical protein [Myxococcus dinghuensis]